METITVSGLGLMQGYGWLFKKQEHGGMETQMENYCFRFRVSPHRFRVWGFGSTAGRIAHSKIQAI